MVKEILYGEYDGYRKSYYNEAPKRMEVKKGETIIGNFLEMRKTRKDEIIECEKAKIVDSDDYIASIKLINKYSIKVNEIAHRQHKEDHEIEMKYWRPKHRGRMLVTRYNNELNENEELLRRAKNAYNNESERFVPWNKTLHIQENIKHIKELRIIIDEAHDDATDAYKELEHEYKHEIRMIEEKYAVEIGNLLAKLYDEAPMLIVMYGGKLVPKVSDKALANSGPIISSLEDTYHKTIKDVSEKMLDTFAESNKKEPIPSDK